MVIDDGVISTLNVEESILACNVSSSEALFSLL
jgi:peroxiredoxin